MKTFKELMESCGMHTKGLANILPKDIYTVRHWVAGNRKPDPEAVKRLTKLSKFIEKEIKEK